MELSDVRAVIATTDASLVNLKLGEGWSLIAITPSPDKQGDGVVFTLGLPSIPTDGLITSQDFYSVILTNVGNYKISVIREVRNATDIFLHEAKELVDAADARGSSQIMKGVSLDRAKSLCQAIKEAGGTATVSLSN